MAVPDKDTVALDEEELGVLDAIRRVAPKHHINPKLAQTYGVWTICFRRYCHEKGIPWLWMSSVSDFMDFLDAHPNVSTAERNRALDGIMFYITDVHKTRQNEDDEPDEAAGSSVPRSTRSLFAKMLLHCDVELTEALNLRRQHVRLEEASVHVPGANDRDSRTVSLPSPLHEGLKDHVQRVEDRTSDANPLLFGPHAPAEGRDPSAPDPSTEAELDRSTELATRVMRTFEAEDDAADPDAPESGDAESE